MNYKYLEFSIKDSICTLLINRENKLNALSIELIKELLYFFEWSENNNEISVIIFSGKGNKAFIAGADIEEMSKLKKTEALDYSLLGQKLTLVIENLSKPVIACINGYALGGGCEIAMACHIRYAAKSAFFGQPEVGLGLIAGFGGTQRLSRLVGKGIAFELLLSGKMIDSSKALEIKLINNVVEDDILIKECYSLAKKIKKNSLTAIKNTIIAINKGESDNIEDALSKESKLFSQTFSSSDCKEGLNAFLNKKKPKFSKS